MRRPEDGEEAVTAGQDSHRLKQRATRSTGRCRYLKLKSGGGAALRVTGSVRRASMSDTACVDDSAAPLICREDDSHRMVGLVAAVSAHTERKCAESYNKLHNFFLKLQPAFW